MATTLERNAFIDTIGPIAAKVCKERGYGNAQAWTCVAQACCESNYGKASLMKNANAFFGIKANSKWVKEAKYGGLVYSSKTKECYDGKTLTTITDSFRAYKNMEDSVRDYFDLIEGPRYRESLKALSVNGCIQMIKNGGYATAINYVQTIMSFYNLSRERIESYSVDGINTSVQKKEITRPTIKLGSVGQDVIYLHKKLRALKYGVDVTSPNFTELTQQCVMHFQKVNNIAMDGIVGPVTWDLLIHG